MRQRGTGSLLSERLRLASGLEPAPQPLQSSGSEPLVLPSLGRAPGVESFRQPPRHEPSKGTLHRLARLLPSVHQPQGFPDFFVEAVSPLLVLPERPLDSNAGAPTPFAAQLVPTHVRSLGNDAFVRGVSKRARATEEEEIHGRGFDIREALQRQGVQLSAANRKGDDRAIRYIPIAGQFEHF